MTVGERIKNRRKELGLSVDAVAKKLNKNRATVYRYESDEIENLPITVLEPLAKILNTTPAYLMGWDEVTDEIIDKKTTRAELAVMIEACFNNKTLYELIIELESKNAPQESIDKISYLYPEFKKIINVNTPLSKATLKVIEPNSIPVLGTIAAGTPILAEQNIETYFSIDSSIKADFALKVKGDSMIKANIHDGDIVFIKKQCDIENGEIGAVLIDDEATLKRVYKENGTLTLQAENDNYAPRVYTNGNIRILGKMVANLKIYN